MPDKKINSLRYEFLVIGLFIILIIFTTIFNPVVNFIARSSENCSLIKNIYQQKFCYIDLAIQKKDPKICINLENGGSSERECYENVAKAKNDITVCENIIDNIKYVKNGCYRYFIYLPNAEIKICDMMSPKYYQELCHSLMDQKLK